MWIINYPIVCYISAIYSWCIEGLDPSKIVNLDGLYVTKGTSRWTNATSDMKYPERHLSFDDQVEHHTQNLGVVDSSPTPSWMFLYSLTNLSPMPLFVFIHKSIKWIFNIMQFHQVCVLIILKWQNGSHIEYKLYIKFQIYPKIIILRVYYDKNDFYSLTDAIGINQKHLPFVLQQLIWFGHIYFRNVLSGSHLGFCKALHWLNI